MAEKRPNKLKLKLSKTDTNRLKTDTSRQKVDSTDTPSRPPDAAANDTIAVQPADGAELDAGAVGAETHISDPMSLRDTATNKLHRIQGPEEGATAVAPAAADFGGGRPTETVRLKVVREKKKQLSNILTASQTIHLRPSALKEEAAASAPGAAAPPQKDDPAKTAAALPPPPSQAASDTIKVTPPTAAPATPAAAPSTPPSAPPSAPPTTPQADKTDDATVIPMSAAKSATATLKIRPRLNKKPGEAAPPPAAAASTDNKSAKLSATSTMKIRPAAGRKITPPTGDGDAETKPSMPPPAATAAPPKPPEASSTPTQAVKLAEPTEKTSKLSLQLKKPKAKAAAAPALPGLAEGSAPDAAKTQVAGPPEPTASSTVAVSLPDEPDASKTVAIAAPEPEKASATVAVPAPVEEAPPEKKKGGLKLKSGKKEAGGPAAVVAKEEADRLAVATGQAKPSVLVVITSLASAVAAGVALGFMIMDFLQFCK
ncbi:MAG: hypothetical protein HN742_32535 [Lentisphaerae bacterium]|nr:hypothetical protein [Lentisphaerota bacterium]MBT5608986.1 hypothetical protein [Lentisphaerota bacterium]MBT7054663.1 hypothetical protein [Lentisphaerota bacterium]MBT7846643.1 hypothetical protein [Lentisphaerota bacterium]